jgi:hypothetical protein
LALLAVPGIAFGLVALRETRRYEQGGRRLALWGLSLSLVIGLGGPLLEICFYHSEAPAGFRRLNYSGALGERELDQFAGHSVCLKGYALADDREVVDRFILTHDGYSRDLLNPILVELAFDRPWQVSRSAVAVSGRLELLPASEDDPDFPRYVLRDAVVRPSRTLYQPTNRDTSEGC